MEDRRGEGYRLKVYTKANRNTKKANRKYRKTSRKYVKDIRKP